MKAAAWKLLLAASLLVNVGVIGAAAWSAWQAAGAGERALFGIGHEQIAERLGLDASQRKSWHDLEVDFVSELNATARQIESHRDRMVRTILSAKPDPATIERERAAIFSLQEAQQRAVIAQLLNEREMLNSRQRATLAEFLLAQPVGASHPR